MVQFKLHIHIVIKLHIHIVIVISIFDFVKLDKSSILPLYSNGLDVTALTTPIPLCTGHITCLGISVSPKLSELISLNITPLLKTTRKGNF